MQVAAGSLNTNGQESAVLTAVLTETAARLFVWPIRTDGLMWLHFQPGGVGSWIPMQVTGAVTTLTVKSGDKLKISLDFNGDPSPAAKNYRLDIA